MTVTATYLGSATAEQQPEPRPQYQPWPQSADKAAPCCEKAERVRCVCIASWKCPVHGYHCYGSHD